MNYIPTFVLLKSAKDYELYFIKRYYQFIGTL